MGEVTMGKPLVKNTDRFIESEIDDEAVLMDLDSGDFFSLAGPAHAIWLLIDGTRDRDAIAASLARDYDAAVAELGSDVDRFVDELTELGFLAVG